MARKVLYAKSVVGDCSELALSMRGDDRRECEASGLDAFQSLTLSLARSNFATTARIDGRVLAMFGVVPLGGTLVAPEAGWAWVLTSELVERHPREFYRESKRVLAEMVRRFPVLVNQVDGRYTRAHAWLKALGFAFHPAVPVGPSGLPFFPVSLGEV